MHALAIACTTFLLATANGPLVGKCYDWHLGDGLVLVNKRGVDKRALPMHPDDRPAAWRSAHASVTFNQYGREMPNGGMNDAGLVVEVMWLDATGLPPPDARPTVNELQWIQYQLDRFATVEEVAAHAGELRVARVSGRVHYLACDRGGACAAIEFVGGKLVVTRGGELVAPVLTNSTYAASAAALAAHGRVPAAPGAGSLQRFVRIADLLRGGARDPLAVLDSANNDSSRWHIVYDPVHLTVEWRTRAQSKLKRVSLAQFPPGCGAPVEMLDIDADAAGDVTARFAPYREDANLKLLDHTLRTVSGLDPGLIPAVAHYPSQLPCSAP